MVAIIVQREYSPWLRESDDRVAYAAQWVVFCFLFSLQIYRELNTLPPELWGSALVILVLGLLVFTAHAGYSDLHEERRKYIVSNDDGEREYTATRSEITQQLAMACADASGTTIKIEPRPTPGASMPPRGSVNTTQVELTSCYGARPSGISFVNPFALQRSSEESGRQQRDTEPRARQPSAGTTSGRRMTWTPRSTASTIPTGRRRHSSADSRTHNPIIEAASPPERAEV